MLEFAVDENLLPRHPVEEFEHIARPCRGATIRGRVASHPAGVARWGATTLGRAGMLEATHGEYRGRESPGSRLGLDERLRCAKLRAGPGPRPLTANFRCTPKRNGSK